jgi:uncharacterized membrane-anchored protein
MATSDGIGGVAYGDLTAGRVQPSEPYTASRYVASKVPQVTVYFWIIKVLSTALGESTSDYMVHTINPYTAVGIGFVAFVASLALQFSVRKYVTWIYWLAVAMVAVFGTMAADVLHVALGVPYLVSTTFFAAALAVIFVVWYWTERTLSIHSINTPRREVFYWAAVVTSFALGTAAGDMSARTVNLGYLGSFVFFAAVIAIPAVAYWLFRLNAVVAFWFAYIVTRPVGASLADYLGFPHSVGGVGLGHPKVSLTSWAVFLVLVAVMALTRKDVQKPTASAEPHGRHRA